jgi:hypothetical protein
MPTTRENLSPAFSLAAFIGSVPLMLASGTSNRTPRTPGQSDVYHQALSDQCLKEQDVYGDHDCYQCEYVKHDACLPSPSFHLTARERHRGHG